MTSGVRGGPGSGDPTRIEYQNMPLAVLITMAYGVDHNQVSGPDWLNTERFDIVAKVPPGSTRVQCQAMLRNLLAERFHLKARRETKELPTYSLVVAKNGPKLKPHVEAPPPADAEGNPVMLQNYGMASANGKSRFRIDNQGIAGLVSQLSGQLGAPVEDDTGLMGKYDIELQWASRRLSTESETDTGPDLFAAVQEQLGLKLEKKKGAGEVLVIDHVDRVPTEN